MILKDKNRAVNNKAKKKTDIKLLIVCLLANLSVAAIRCVPTKEFPEIISPVCSSGEAIKTKAGPHS